jgi:GntR family transcriptional regulator
MAQQPMYQKIAEDLRRRIDLGASLASVSDYPEGPDPAEGNADGDSASAESGNQLPAELKPGSQLPTELELCNVYAASRNTIRDAVKLLTGLNLVETRPGQGTFVVRKVDPFVTILSSAPDPKSLSSAPDPKTLPGGVDPESAAYLSEVSKKPRKAATSAPKVEMQVPPPEVALRLRLKPKAQAVSRHQERVIDDVPWSLQTSFYPMQFITDGATELLMARDIPGGAVRYLAATLNVREVGQRDWITTRNPDQNEQKFFELAQDSTVFVIYRTGFDQERKPMRVTVTIFRADRNQFIVDSGDVPDPQYGSDADSESLDG